MMNNTAIKIVAFMIISLCTFAQTADDIFKNHIDATGGKALWDSVSTYSIKQAYQGNSAANYDVELKGSFSEAALYKAKTILKRTFIFGIKGAEGWRKVPLGSSDKITQYETNSLSEKEQENMRRELKENILPFLDYEEKGYIATMVGSETINGTKTTHVELSGKGVKYNLYFDEITRLLTRKKLTVTTGEVITEDYNKYGDSAYGLKFPTESNYFSSIDKRNLKVSTSIIFNDIIAPAFLTR
jgi:putative salt-induced outer membrane protein